MKIKDVSESKGFTLIELIVVMTIIATLAAISFGVLNAVLRNSYDKVTKARLKSIDDGIVRFLADNRNSSLPTGNGDEDSSIALYQILTYDFDLNGEQDAITASAGFEEFDILGCKFTVYNGDKPLMPDLLESSSPPKVSAKYQILDPTGNPLRYYHEHGGDGNKGNQNQLDNGYDLWGAGKDGQTNEDSTDLGGNKDDIKNDDITNWSDA